jgi:hypothetical protein
MCQQTTKIMHAFYIHQSGRAPLCTPRRGRTDRRCIGAMPNMRKWVVTWRPVKLHDPLVGADELRIASAGLGTVRPRWRAGGLDQGLAGLGGEHIASLVAPLLHLLLSSPP